MMGRLRDLDVCVHMPVLDAVAFVSLLIICCGCYNFCCRVFKSAWTLCVCAVSRFLSHSRDIHVSLMCDFKLIIDINVSVSVCPSIIIIRHYIHLFSMPFKALKVSFKHKISDKIKRNFKSRNNMIG